MLCLGVTGAAPHFPSGIVIKETLESWDEGQCYHSLPGCVTSLCVRGGAAWPAAGDGISAVQVRGGCGDLQGQAGTETAGEA